MKKMKYQNVRGTKDYLPREESLRRSIRRVLEDCFIQYGYQALETPILNYTELLASKYAGGAAILEEMYRLTDRGERDLALRYDLTIPFAKVMALNPTLGLPFKRYEIGKVFRDGPIKTGRLREFTQCDVDLVGVESQTAEVELFLMAIDVFEQLNLEITIQYNNRKLLTGILAIFGVEEATMNEVILILDKLEKIGSEKVMALLQELGLSSGTLSSIQAFLTDGQEGCFEYFQAYLEQSELVREGLAELQALDSLLQALGIDAACSFNPFLARGLDMYTGTIYEVFLRDGSIQSSIASGGRYDNAIGGLMGSDQSLATVGLSFGLDVIYTALSMTDGQLGMTSDIDYYMIPLNQEEEAFRLAMDLRKKGYRVELELSGKKLAKALAKANKEQIPYVIILGEEEVRNKQYKLKNMQTGKEELRDLPDQSIFH